MADAYFSLGINEKAIINYENALKLNQMLDEVYYNLAVCLYIQGEYSSSLLNIQKALKLDSTNEAYM